ncbi:hypothetical protein GQ457_10G004900 [Hibiscus cannabinus]
MRAVLILTLKLNVDASVKGSYGETDIEGILRDHFGNPLLKFSGSIGLSNPTVAELLAIFRACQLVADSKWNMLLTVSEISLYIPHGSLQILTRQGVQRASALLREVV